MTKASLQLLVTCLLLLAAIASSTVSSASKEPYKREGAKPDETRERPVPTREDCNFLNNPETITRRREHIQQLSKTTDTIAIGKLPITFPNKIPLNGFIDE